MMTRRNKARCFQHLNKISLTILFSKLVLLLLFTFFLVSASASSNNFPGLVRFKNGTIGMFAQKEILIHGEVHVGGDVYVSGNQNSMMFMFKTLENKLEDLEERMEDTDERHLMALRPPPNPPTM